MTNKITAIMIIIIMIIIVIIIIITPSKTTTIKVNYNYHKNDARILLGNFLKSFITLTILYVEECHTTTR